MTEKDILCTKAHHFIYACAVNAIIEQSFVEE